MADSEAAVPPRLPMMRAMADLASRKTAATCALAIAVEAAVATPDDAANPAPIAGPMTAQTMENEAQNQKQVDGKKIHLSSIHHQWATIVAQMLGQADLCYLA